MSKREKPHYSVCHACFFLWRAKLGRWTGLEIRGEEVFWRKLEEKSVSKFSTDGASRANRIGWSPHSPRFNWNDHLKKLRPLHVSRLGPRYLQDLEWLTGFRPEKSLLLFQGKLSRAPLMTVRFRNWKLTSAHFSAVVEVEAELSFTFSTKNNLRCLRERQFLEIDVSKSGECQSRLKFDEMRA